MAALHDHQKLQLELYADGELDANARAEVEALLASSAEARQWLEILSELRVATTLPFDFAAESVDFERMQSELFARLQSEPEPYDESLEILTMAWADGELHDPREVERVVSYLADSAAARELLDVHRDVRNAALLSVNHAAEQVDFSAMTARIMEAVTPPAPVHAPSKRPVIQDETPSLWQTVVDFFMGNRVPIAGFAGVALATLIFLPTLLKSPQTNVTNHYYLGEASVEAFKAEPGHRTSVREGNDIYAPVVWIEAAPEDANDVAPSVAEPPSEEPDKDGLAPKIIDL